MQTIITTALSVFTLAVFLQVQGIATEPTADLPTPPTPTAPETWNVWGQAELDGLIWTARPVACEEDAAGSLCVEVTMQNPGEAVQTGEVALRLNATTGSPMSRMPPTPETLESKNVVLQAAAGESASAVLTFSLPEQMPSELTLVVGGDVDDIFSGQGVAAFSSFAYLLEGASL